MGDETARSIEARRFCSARKTQTSWEPKPREKLRLRGVISSLDLGAETPYGGSTDRKDFL